VADRLETDGPAAPPRDNGELVFAAPWQGRAFGLTVALEESGRLDWDEFRDRLIAELTGAGDAHPDTYWAAWLRATEALIEPRLAPDGELDRRLAAYASRPASHDHDHDDPGDVSHSG
jgi:nitrile hydratase accessory protein